MKNNTTECLSDEIEIIINKYGDMLYRICILMLKNESDAEDVLQETLECIIIGSFCKQVYTWWNTEEQDVQHRRE